MMNRFNPLTMNNQQPLASQTSQEMRRVAANSQVPLAQLQGLAQAQTYMQDAALQRSIEIPKVNFYPSNHGNPKKARRADIRQAYKLLSPTKRSIVDPRRYWFGGKYQFVGDATRCCIEGCDVDELIQAAGNVYEMIKDEDTGKSLWELYFKDPVTGQPIAFQARERVTGGRILRATYCPEHLHLYHLLCKWESEADKDHNKTKTGMREMVKKGVSTIAVPISIIKKKDNTPELLQKYEPFFVELEKDSKRQPGISLLHYKNPETGINDVTMIVFDLRLFQKEILEQQPSLADAITNLGIMQAQAVDNGVINSEVVAQAEQMQLPQQ